LVFWLQTRVARWYSWIPKIPMRVHMYRCFEGPWNVKRLYILFKFGTFYGHLMYFVVSWYIFLHFGMWYQEKSGNPV
jgi:hypothetical protein